MNPLSVNILERLLKGGINYIPLPHRVGCCCTECSTKQKADGLRLRGKRFWPDYGPVWDWTGLYYDWPKCGPVFDGLTDWNSKINLDYLDFG